MQYSAIEPHEVHIWILPLSKPLDPSITLQEILSAKELARAEGYRHLLAQQNFVRSRVALRTLLGQYLNIAPQSIILANSPYGKPFIANENLSIDVKFNLAHTENLIVIAITKDNEIGVDVEPYQLVTPQQSLTQLILSQQEQKVLEQSSDPNLDLLKLWVCKEAFAKGLGCATDLSFSAIEFQELPHSSYKAMRVLWIENIENASWYVYDLQNINNHVMALATNVLVKSIQFFNFI